MENIRDVKYRDIKLVSIEKRRNQLILEANYHTTKYFLENLLAIEIKKMRVKRNRPGYLGLSMLDIGKTLMYEFWYDYIKPKYQDNAKLCCMDTGSVIIHIKIKEFYEDIADDAKKIYDASNYEVNRPLPKGKNEKAIGYDKFVAVRSKKYSYLMDDGNRSKTYSYLMDDGNSNKKAKGTKTCVTKRKLKFKNYEDCNEATLLDNIIKYSEKNGVNTDTLKKDHEEFIKNNKLTLKTQQRFKSENHNVFTEEINKIALNSNDDKRIQSIDSTETPACETKINLISEKETIKSNNTVKQYKQ